MKASHKVVESKLASFSKEVEEAHEEVLGSLLFTCSGRTPDSVACAPFFTSQNNSSAQVIDPLDDVRAFHEYFPNTPIAGFYADGEIGPSPSSSSSSSSSSSASQNDNDNINSNMRGAAETGGSDIERSHKGIGLLKTETFDATLQGYTAVFGMFLRPRRMGLGKSNFFNT
jgi:hypothetical protein